MPAPRSRPRRRSSTPALCCSSSIAAIFQNGVTLAFLDFRCERADIATDFVNVWAAGKLVLDGHPALAYDWDIEKQVELALLTRDFIGYFAWHYPPPFLLVAALLAQFSYPVAFLGWVSVSFLPYLAAMRAIIGRCSA